MFSVTRIMTSVIVGLVLMCDPLPALATQSNYPMSVLNQRIDQLKVEIDLLSSSMSSGSMSRTDRDLIRRERQKLTLRVAYLQACKPYFSKLSKDRQEAFIIHTQADPATPHSEKHNRVNNGWVQRRR